MHWMEGWTCLEEVAAGAVIISAADDYWNATYTTYYTIAVETMLHCMILIISGCI
jgi:hypothetical protein